MSYFSENRHGLLMTLVCCLFFLASCATTVSTEKPIEERVAGRWDALLSGDLATAYSYLSPGTRSSVSSLQYQQSFLTQRVAWTGARYVGSECQESTCKVNVSIDYAVYGALPGVKSFKGTKSVEESWLLIDGTWYMVP